MKINNFRLGIGIPLSFPTLPSSFFDSFIIMEKPPFIYLRSSIGQIENMRNEIVKEAINTGCSHLVMMDSDQVYHQQTITKLLSHRKSVVGCLVYRRYMPFDPLMFKGEINSYIRIDDWKKDSLVEVDATGTGCLMFEVDVFRKMPYPWFKTRVAEGGGDVGEDFHFCSNLRAAGYRIFVDTSIPAEHLTQMRITEGTWRLYSKVKEAELKEAQVIKHGDLIVKEDLKNIVA
jgi:hypothetical protein